MLLGGLVVFVAAAAAASSSDDAESSECVYHLHIPKCAGTFVWRFFRGRFCEDPSLICGRENLRLPPHCSCAGNPITHDNRIISAIRTGQYRFVSSHSMVQLGSSRSCAVAAWFREPSSRVASHFGYFRDRRGLNASLSDALKTRRWASNQQWTLFVGRFSSKKPTSRERSKADSLLSSVAFVGLVEEMDASLCLFSTQFLTLNSQRELCNPAKKPIQKENVGRSSSSSSSSGHRRKQHEGESSSILDALVKHHNLYDHTLYELATAHFHSRVNQHPPSRRLVVTNHTR